MTERGVVLNDVETCVDRIIERVGKNVVFGMPLGLGKPNQLVNALYARAKADPELTLTILTALTLEKPTWKPGVEEAFMKPIVDRIYGDCPDIDYIIDLRKNRLPDNVTVREFFFKPGSFLTNHTAQQEYINSNYTHAARDVFANGCNVAAQVVCKREVDGKTMLSMSCNPDTGPELVEMMREEHERSGRPYCVVAQINQQLPYMYNDAEIEPEEWDYIVDNEAEYTTLFSTPKLSVTTPDYMIGLYASALVPDGGTLQIGIGALGDAIVYATELRQSDNSAYRAALRDTGALDQSGDLINAIGGLGTFEKGLYGATEMFVDGFLHLYKAGILKRKVYDFWALQHLINAGRCDPANVDENVLSDLDDLGVRVIRTKDFDTLQRHGLFTSDCSYELGHIVAPDGERIMANLAIPESRHKLAEKCLGTELKNGVVLHGGFFLGPNDFYQGLRDLSEDECRDICMTGVDKINQLDLNPRLYRKQRMNARFINTGIMATLSGAVVSDGLADGRVVSGVGGQYNFVEMAHHLLTGRSILMIRSVREKDGKASSNIVQNYGHITIPRHLRDIVITEYGIADLRSKTDSEVIKALLNVTDSRFQGELLHKARVSGKIEPEYKIPEANRNNTPERLEKAIQEYRDKGLFPAYPFGTDFTEQEQALGKALQKVKARASGSKVGVIWDYLTAGDIPDGAQPFLERMQLTKPKDMQEKIVQKFLAHELKAMGAF